MHCKALFGRSGRNAIPAGDTLRICDGVAADTSVCVATGEPRRFAGELEDALEHESGLTALAGTGVVAALEVDESPEAQLALDIYCYRVAHAVAAMATALGGLDALVFTAGVGEHSSYVRDAVCRQLDFLGIFVNENGNSGVIGDTEISRSAARVRVYVIPSREDVVIARAVRGLL